jgi:hypothetical protein
VGEEDATRPAACLATTGAAQPHGALRDLPRGRAANSATPATWEEEDCDCDGDDGSDPEHDPGDERDPGGNRSRLS